jgi:hypothetical protein
MFLKQRSDGSLVERVSATPLFDPFEAHVMGRFPSGEALPRCWIDQNDQR